MEMKNVRLCPICNKIMVSHVFPNHYIKLLFYCESCNYEFYEIDKTEKPDDKWAWTNYRNFTDIFIKTENKLYVKIPRRKKVKENGL